MRANTPWKLWLCGFLPAQAITPPHEWLRVSVGSGLGLLLSIWLCRQFFAAELVMPLIGPLAASAVLVFAVSSGALAQPWSLLGSYAIATLVGITLGLFVGHTPANACLAVAISVLLMSLLRCLHPPAGAVAFGLMLAEHLVQQQGYLLLLPVMCGVSALLCGALLYNNLTGARYPKRPQVSELHHTHDPLPEQRVGISDDDLEHALEDFGQFVDITREDLGRLVRATEGYALKRSMANLRAEQIMSRDLRCVTPHTSREDALGVLRHHRLRNLPVLNEERRLVGIVSLSDLICRPHGVSPFAGWGLGRKITVAELMTKAVRCVAADTHVLDLIPLLSTQGLHCVPVLEQEALIGIITQTDIIAALQQEALERWR